MLKFGLTERTVEPLIEVLKQKHRGIHSYSNSFPWSAALALDISR